MKIIIKGTSLEIAEFLTRKQGQIDINHIAEELYRKPLAAQKRKGMNENA